MKKIGGIFTGPIVSWFDEAEKRLEELKGFREDWDSYGGHCHVEVERSRVGA